MERWAGKVAVVTGASSGIGAQIAVDLVNAGVNVVALARRKERLEELKTKVSTATKAKLYPVKCDVTIEQDIKDAFAWAEKHLGGVDILVNNAGIIRQTSLLAEDNTADIKATLDTNVLGVVLCTREAFQSMKKRNVAGHVVIINSIAGHSVMNFAAAKFPSPNIYNSTKYGVTAMTEVLRQEFQSFGTKIKITVSDSNKLFAIRTKYDRFENFQSVSPGVVETEIFLPEHLELIKNAQLPMLKSEDISQAVLYAIGTPPHVQVWIVDETNFVELF